MKQSFAYSFKVWFTCAIVPPFLNILLNLFTHSNTLGVSYSFLGLGVAFLLVLLASSMVNMLDYPTPAKKMILLVVGVMAVNIVFFSWKGSAMFKDSSITTLWICYSVIIEASLYFYKLKSWAV